MTVSRDELVRRTEAMIESTVSSVIDAAVDGIGAWDDVSDKDKGTATRTFLLGTIERLHGVHLTCQLGQGAPLPIAEGALRAACDKIKEVALLRLKNLAQAGRN